MAAFVAGHFFQTERSDIACRRQSEGARRRVRATQADGKKRAPARTPADPATEKRRRSRPAPAPPFTPMPRNHLTNPPVIPRSLFVLIHSFASVPFSLLPSHGPPHTTALARPRAHPRLRRFSAKITGPGEPLFSGSPTVTVRPVALRPLLLSLPSLPIKRTNHPKPQHSNARTHNTKIPLTSPNQDKSSYSRIPEPQKPPVPYFSNHTAP
jgi:hypothetical protein